MLPGRHGPNENYRYGFQGQGKDDEVKGEGDSYNYKFRMDDPRGCRFFAVDPFFKKYPFYSPYAFSGNRVLDSKELEGFEPHVLFSTLEEAATNFGVQYNGYSIKNKFEIGTQFYKVLDNDNVIKYAYTTEMKIFGKYRLKVFVKILQDIIFLLQVDLFILFKTQMVILYGRLIIIYQK